MLSLTEVYKTYNHSEKAVSNLNLHVNAGEVFGFLGPNGAGKSTTIKLITGILPLDSGIIKINNINIEQAPLEAKKHLGYVADVAEFFLHFKGIEYLNFLRDIYKLPVEITENKIKETASRLNMVHALEGYIKNYSYGMKKKLFIIGSLLHDPKVWILDEPLNGLDPRSSYMIKELMKEHASQGNTVFFSTHMLAVAEEVCNRVGIIKQGEKLFEGTIEEIKLAMQKHHTSLENLFLELTDDNYNSY
ncbi:MULTISPECIES: ABC transporter ATP-binding protein [unclassified Paenibacillus]|uniref:ABC transporter ATP-binding protein n=1 Tax=unclassified Paenibacillus TaxID=185978 RepID=UPI002404F47B|nr:MULTISPECIES: ABC transporter ATP-binding protein [unclassified Paenibacillus]MDF9842709.1 ABC-2 type transport system ATP-binding protein [Paenibacillus sp. PastF-2]MDF9849423.1 ABC-2 type transport system ATP-binding protein [Paenibacillus sp. PastM-2]MDF9855869.1 ABC-2 type transport system ATP-binding protein [Paenibacillus sp. PastF-1]MDH6481265.1 ABC-2 type transport system ATP-binding protein [Paenibacillus sp. PastH-2]MDH6508684.1 ABC-2 type transport system ATP-binding protein [Pae